MFHASVKLVLLIQIIVVVGLPLFLWKVLHFGRFLPLPIVQICAGIMLGPSICGALFPDVFQFLFRAEVLAGTETLANVAVVLFVFLAGCEADRGVLRSAAGMVVRTALSGLAVPWLLGGLAAFVMVTSLFPADIVARLLGRSDPILYSVAFGLAMSVTALPVLVVILRELGFMGRPIGTIALAIGGIDDMVLWASVAVLLPFAAGEGFWSALAVALGGGLATILLVWRIAAPFLERMVAQEASERILMSLVILTLFTASAITEATGLHAVVGAFVTGLFLPDKLRHMSESRFDVPVTLLLLPFFFLATGLKTHFDFADPTIWAVVAIAFVVCIGGKIGGIAVPALLGGQSLGFSLMLGVLMQCKGLMEIVVVTVLFQRGIVGELTFSALVLVALLSTVLTAPLARLTLRVFGPAATETAEHRPVEVATSLPTPAEPAVVAVAEARAESAAPVPVAARAELAAPALVFDDDGLVLPLPKAEVSLGRHKADDVQIKDLRVSRHHALLKQTGPGRFEIHNLTADRSEPNPMLVNGVEREHAEIRDGDHVDLGGVGFVFRERLPSQQAAA